MRSIDFGSVSFFQMQLCLSIQELGSFTKAAMACHVTQPTLSKRVSELEIQLGLLLFIRGKNTSVRPTAAGRIVLEEWKGILTMMERSLLKGYDAQANMSPTIVVGANPTADKEMYLSPLIDDYSEKVPGVEFRFFYAGTPAFVEGLLTGEVDVVFMPAFRRSMFERTPLRCYQVLTAGWYVGMLPGNPLAKKENLSFGNLRQQRFVLPTPQLYSDYYAFIEGMCKPQGFLPQVSFMTKNHLSIPDNVRSEDEIFIVDGYSSVLGDERFRFIQLDGVESGIIMSFNENNNKPVVQTFQRYARAFFRDFPTQKD